MPAGHGRGAPGGSFQTATLYGPGVSGCAAAGAATRRPARNASVEGRFTCVRVAGPDGDGDGDGGGTHWTMEPGPAIIGTLRDRIVLWVSFAVACAAVLPACGECVFSEKLRGHVRDASGRGLAHARVATCSGDRCTSDPAKDSPCRSTMTNEHGAFELDVHQCRPAACECELRPVVVEREGCKTATIQPVRQTPAEVTLDCN